MTVLRVACIQMTSGPEIGPNLEHAAEMIREGAGRGAKLIATPENTCHIRNPARDKLGTAPAQEDHPVFPVFSGLARELGVWLLAGSVSVRVGPEKIANRSILFSDTGSVAATYDKIHMFDVALPTGEKHRESDLVQPGETAVVAATPWGGLGMTICYDLRFSYLFRALAQAGAGIIAVPSAFTVPTGRAHWATLLRARAIETGSFIIAPGQTGEHQNGRRTWGHSMIIGPWGEIMAEASDQPVVITADLDLAEVTKARQSIPALTHDRKFTVQA